MYVFNIEISSRLICFYVLALKFHFLNFRDLWGPSAKLFVKEILQRLFNHSGDSRDRNLFLQYIILAIQRGNNTSILGSLPHGPYIFDIIYYI